MLILPGLTLFCLACSGEIRWEYLPFCLACFLNGIVIEIGRKIRAPEDEIFGVETYSSIWTPKKASCLWGIAMTSTLITAAYASIYIDFVGGLTLILGLFLCIGLRIGFVYVKRLDRPSARWIDKWSGIWTMMLYLSLGIIPYFK